MRVPVRLLQGALFHLDLLHAGNANIVTFFDQRITLACHRRLVYLELAGLQADAVNRDLVSVFKLNDISDKQEVLMDFFINAVSHDHALHASNDRLLTVFFSICSSLIFRKAISFLQSTNEPTLATSATAIKMAVPSTQAI